MKLYGTVTSPFVRRVRVVAAELGVSVELFDTSNDAGQMALAEVTPLKKVPTAVLDGETVFDSRVINEQLFRRHGQGPFRALGTDVEDWNMLNAIDGALESGIRTFYFRRDGMALDATPYLIKEQSRVIATMAWIASRLRGGQTTRHSGLGYPELALLTALDWFKFREVYDWQKDARFGEFAAAWRDRPSFAATAPR
jgi:glutathione S-transferase